MKRLTADQVQSRKDKAVRFTRDVLGDEERADEIEDEDLEDYADRRRIAIVNSGRSNEMAGDGKADARTKQDLLDEIDDLQQENQDLQDALDAVADIVSPSDEADDDDVEDDDQADDQD